MNNKKSYKHKHSRVKVHSVTANKLRHGKDIYTKATGR